MSVFDEVGEGVYRRRYESLDLNVGVVIGEDGLLVVDTRASHVQARELLEELSSFSSLPVRWVVNTHYHWDHTFGNSVFSSAEIWGHERCASALEQSGAQMKEQVKSWVEDSSAHIIDEIQILPPTRTFSESASIAIGRKIDLTYHGLAHTDSDIVIRVADADVAFFGDIVEEGAPPSFGDAFPKEWADTVRRAAVGCPSVVVPGHGDVVDESFVLGQADEIEQVAAIVDRGGDLSAGPYPLEVMQSAATRISAQ